MAISMISFTERGMALSVKLAEALGQKNLAVFTKCSLQEKNTMPDFMQYTGKSIGEWAGEQMRERHTLLFIGACGIAVRAIAPYLTDKLTDSPVLVMDEGGKYIIPVLSGHVGGANEMAVRLASLTGAIPVITTATDINEKFAVDVFAKRNGLYIVNKDGIAKVSAKVLAGKRISMAIEPGHMAENTLLPEKVDLIPYSPGERVDIAITTQEQDVVAALWLKPREYSIGIGCKRGKAEDKIREFILKSMEKAGISITQIFALASIDRKQDEEGILAWCRKERIPFLTFSAEQLRQQKGDFSASAFVKEQVGVDNVCERAALQACKEGGTLIYKKHAEDGMTIAIAKREWSVVFYEK